jgi:hypothetical protein
MKLNRIITPAAITLLVVGVMSAIGMKVVARTSHSVIQSQDCSASQGDDLAEIQSSGPDTRNVDQQYGDQNAPDTGAETAGTNVKIH